MSVVSHFYSSLGKIFCKKQENILKYIKNVFKYFCILYFKVFMCAEVFCILYFEARSSKSILNLKILWDTERKMYFKYFHESSLSSCYVPYLPTTHVINVIWLWDPETQGLTQCTRNILHRSHSHFFVHHYCWLCDVHHFSGLT